MIGRTNHDISFESIFNDSFSLHDTIASTTHTCASRENWVTAAAVAMSENTCFFSIPVHVSLATILIALFSILFIACLFPGLCWYFFFSFFWISILLRYSEMKRYIRGDIELGWWCEYGLFSAPQTPKPSGRCRVQIEWAGAVIVLKLRMMYFKGAYCYSMRCTTFVMHTFCAHHFPSFSGNWK